MISVRRGEIIRPVEDQDQLAKNGSLDAALQRRIAQAPTVADATLLTAAMAANMNTVSGSRNSNPRPSIRAASHAAHTPSRVLPVAIFAASAAEPLTA